MNLIEGKSINREEAREFLRNILPQRLCETRQISALPLATVISAADRVSRKLCAEKYLPLLYASGINPDLADEMLLQAKSMLSAENLLKKVERELGNNPFALREIEQGIYTKLVPLGVITHIAAGNASGLPAYSVLEGLLTGNINLLKLPGHDDGLSTALLEMLIEEEPLLSKYIYIFDLPSADIEAIKAMLHISNAVSVWGSDFAISGIRAIAPVNTAIIEWGHKISFAYITKKGAKIESLKALASEICRSEQLMCSSPQCIYYECEYAQSLSEFAEYFFNILSETNKEVRQVPLDIAAQAEVTAAIMVAKAESLLKTVQIWEKDGCSVIIDDKQALHVSPMFRNVLIKRACREQIFSLFHPFSGVLQTVGLACDESECEELSELFYRAGVIRITPCGKMTHQFAGEAHDGRSALKSYVKEVTLWKP